MAQGKRKRGDRTVSIDTSQDGSQRPSPHRPGNTALAQQSREQENRWRGGGRRQSRGGRGGAGVGQGQRQDTASNPRSPNSAPNGVPPSQKTSPVAATAPPPESTPPQPPIQAQAPDPPKAAPQPNRNSAQDQPQPRPDPPPYDWEYMSDEIVKSWNEQGKKNLVDTAVQAQLDEDGVALGAMFQELLQAGLRGLLEPAVAGTVVHEIIERGSASDDDQADKSTTAPAFDSQLLFLDCLSILAEYDMSNPHLPTVVYSTQIDPLLMRHHLDATLLQKLGLIRSTFGRVGIRKTTNTLYRQSNYNLLREETEGYAKLITELFSTSNNQLPTSEVVEETFERVRALVGAFNLDVGRVLDVTLDVFASVLVKQYRFFVKLLRASSWWPQSSKFDSIDNTRVGFDSLPSWALPGSTTWQSAGEEKQLILEARTRRDSAFWGSVRERGMAAFFELGGRRVEGQQLAGSSASGEEQNHALEASDQAWIEATGCVPPQGNRVAAQLLGFKLRFYSSTTRDASDILPGNLIYLAALLIKVGFISLRDLYPHLWPLDEGMEALKEQKMKEKAEKEKLNRPGGGAANALMTAGALSDDTLPSMGRLRETDGNRGTPARKVEEAADKTTTGGATDEKETLPEPVEQKVQLLKSLLCIGALPESLFILGRFPWIIDAFPEVPDYLHRILHHCLSKVYEPLRPLNERPSLRAPKKIADLDQSGVAKGQIRLLDAPPRRVLRWALPDKEDMSESTDFRFYWDDWADNVPVCQTVDDIFTLCGTLLNLSGVKIGRDPALLIKLARIGQHSLSNDSNEANVARWVDLSKRLLVPSLSLTKTNPGVVNEVFDLIKNFSTSERYSIYAECCFGSISRLPDITAAFDQAKAETKDVLKRISKTNVKSMARALAKVAYSSPGVVFTVAISQIEAYDNLVEVVVECARYFTTLGYDVLTWSLMSSLGGKGRNRVQADGMLTSKWLAALSLFAGRVFKRYSGLMNPTPILQYVADQLRKGNTTDLLVLKEITTSMAGVVPDTNFNDAQTLAMAGGDLLRQQTLLQLHDKRHECKNTAKRLMRSLTEPKLAGQLLISIAQERQTCVFSLPEPDAHVKILGNLFDEIHRVLAQYLDLLRSNLSIKDFDQLVPDVSELILEYGVEPSVAFWISRLSITHAMSEAAKVSADVPLPVVEIKEKEEEKQGKLADADGDIEMKAEDQLVSTDASKEGPKASINGVIEVSSADTDLKDKSTTPDLAAPATAKDVSEPWSPVLGSLMDQIKPIFPDETWSQMSVSFYVTFWQLSLYDIQVPSKSYEEEVARLKTRWIQVKDDRSDMSIAGSARKEREKKQLTETQDRLRDELKGHIQAFSQTKARILREKNHWFEGRWGKWDVLNDALLQYCILPRLLLSATDAIFCFKMVKLLHSTGTPNFRTMGFLDYVFRQSRVANVIFTCTTREAENYGRFLNETLKDLNRWHTDKAVYEKEAFGAKRDLPGFARKLIDQVPESLLDYEDFRRLLYKWHRNVSAALKSCLTGGDYMHIRNAIIVLKAIHEHFPVVNWQGRDQTTSVTELSKSEKREDLKIAATSLLGNLKKREKHWILPQAFNLVSVAKPVAQANGTEVGKVGSPAPNGARSGSARPNTPHPAEGTGTRQLSAAAPEFQPKSQPIGTESKDASSAATKAEAEDGEIDDSKPNDSSATAKEAPKSSTTTADVQPPGETTVKAISETKLSDAAAQQEPSNQNTPSTPAPVQPSADSNIPPTAASKPNEKTPAGVPAKPAVGPPQRPSRVEPSRVESPAPGSLRPQHSLPNRPEPVPRPSERRPGDRLDDRRDPRDQKYPEQPRSDRPGDYSRDHGPERRLPPAPPYRGQDRGSDRLSSAEWDRRNAEGGSNREASSRLASEDRFDRSYDTRAGAQTGDRDDRAPRDRLPLDASSEARPQNSRQLPRDPPMAPPRAAPQPHSSRASLIEGDSGRRPTQPRSARESWDGRSSRPGSPRPPEDRASSSQYGYNEPRGDERPRYGDRSASMDGVSARTNESRPPSGPRGERSGRQTPSESHAPESDRAGDLFGSSNNQPPPRTQDRAHERESDHQSASRQQDPNYGRLNSVPEIPSGPRGNQSSRGGRNPPPPPQSRPKVRPSETSTSSRGNSPPAPDRAPPTGPSNRNHPRSGSVQIDHPIQGAAGGSASAPQTPATDSGPKDLGGMHPDRLKEMQNTPDRSTFARQSAPATDTSRPPNRPPSTAPPTPGPRGSQQALPSPIGPPTLDSRVSAGPPTSSNDRSRGDKRFAGIQNVLQQGGTSSSSEKSDRGTSIRGRGGRSSGINPHSPNSEPVTPMPTRTDPLASRVTLPPLAHPDDQDRAYGRGARSYENERETELRRSERRRSRSPRRDSRGREPSGRDDERYSVRDDYRDRRGGSGSIAPLGPVGPLNNGGGVRDDRGSGPPRSGRDAHSDSSRSERDGRMRDSRDPRDLRDRDREPSERGMPPSRSWGGDVAPPPPPPVRMDTRQRHASGRDERDRDRDQDHESSSSRRDGRKRGRGGDDLLDGRGGGGGHGDKRPRRNI